MLNLGDTKALRAALVARNDESYQTGETHQSILNICYEKWRSMEKASYGDMISWAQMQYGPFAALMVLLGKYNYQVENGGHAQYYDNGYASGDGGCFRDHDTSLPLHRKLLKWVDQMGLRTFDLGERFYANASKMEISESDDSGWGSGWDDDEETVVNGDALDDEYYEFNDEWMKLLNAICVEELGGGPKKKAPRKKASKRVPA